MIIDERYVIGIATIPCETDSILPIDANAVLTFSFTQQLFEPIAWRYLKIVKRSCRVQDQELPKGRSLDVFGEILRWPTPKHFLRLIIREVTDHRAPSYLNIAKTAKIND
jgi:hypothetical protein